MRNVVKDHADIPREQVERIRDLMNLHVRDCLVTGYEPLIGGLTLPDQNDRHVLATAIRCGADTIVTFNLKDFPEEALKPYGIEAQHPDEFLNCQLDLAPNVVCSAAKKHAAEYQCNCNFPWGLEMHRLVARFGILISVLPTFGCCFGGCSETISPEQASRESKWIEYKVVNKRFPVIVDVLVTLTAIVQREPDAGGYSASIPALPGCHTQGETLEEVRANLREAAEGWLAVAHDDALAREAAGESS